jgi:branched-chain amino acid transport system substrate-binding protein
VLALAAGGDDAGRIAREVQAQGLKVQLIGTSSLQSAGAAFYAAGGSAVEGTISASQYDPQSNDPIASKLLDQAEKDTNQTDIPLNFAYAYDAVGMLVNAIKKSSITPTSDIAQARTAVRDDIQSQGTFTGMAAQTSFKEDGTSVRPQLLAIFKGQNFAIQR